MLAKIEMTKQMLKDGSKDFLNWTRKNYCPYCKRKIQPKRKTSWSGLIILGIIGLVIFGIVGLVFGIIFSLVIDSTIGSKVCPICGCKESKLEYFGGE